MSTKITVRSRRMMGFWRLFECPSSPEVRRELRFARDIGDDAAGFIAPVDALEGLHAVAAEQADVAADAMGGGGFEVQRRQGNRELEGGVLCLRFLVLLGAATEGDLVADVVHAIENDGAQGRAELHFG